MSHSARNDHLIDLDLETQGDRLKFARQRLKITQADLSSLSGIHQSILSAYERNSRGISRMNIAYMLNLSRILKVSIDWIMTGKAEGYSLDGKLESMVDDGYAPLISWKDVHQWKMFGKETMNLANAELIPIHGYKGDNCFALIIDKEGVADSSFDIGDTIVVDAVKTPEKDNYILVSRDNGETIVVHKMLDGDQVLFWNGQSEFKIGVNMIVYGVLVAKIKKLV